MWFNFAYLTLPVLLHAYCTWEHCDVDAEIIYCPTLTLSFILASFGLKGSHIYQENILSHTTFMFISAEF